MQTRLQLCALCAVAVVCLPQLDAQPVDSTARWGTVEETIRMNFDLGESVKDHSRAAGSAPLVVPPGVFDISNTIVISTPITIAGAGMGANHGELGGIPAGTMLRWVGPKGQPMFEVRGPIPGVVIRDLSIDCQDACEGIVMDHAFHSTVERVSILRPNDFALRLRSTRQLQPGIAVGAGGNRFTQLRIFLSRPYTTGVILGASDTLSIGSSANVFDQVSVLGSHAPGQTGVRIGNADYIDFRMLTVYYCDRSMHMAPPLGAAHFPQGIYLYMPSFDRPPTWDGHWNPYPAAGIIYERYWREWNGGPPQMDTSWSPLEPQHPAIWGTSNVRR